MDITKYYAIPGERPLDNIKPDGGFCGIFRSIACIGDSLSSGEFQSTDENGYSGYHDMFEYSWGRYMARALGCKVYNFSRGGMTAKEYLNSFAESRGMWDEHLASQAYIIALGVNDMLNARCPVGSISDIDFENPENSNKIFAGYYANIIFRYKKISPRARFFLMSMPRENDNDNPLREAHAKFLHELAAKIPNTYVIDLYAEAPVYDSEFHRNFYMNGHLNPAGYLLTANMVMTYIDYIIRNNPEKFRDVPFIGTSFHE